jgi:hypothetical protein
MLQHIPALSDFDKGDGTCRHLQNNLCNIYNSRPMICDVNRMYYTFFNDIFSEEEFISMNIEACKNILEAFNNHAVKRRKVAKCDIRFKNMTPLIFKLFRPKDISSIVPDCGWNHGESKESCRQ